MAVAETGTVPDLSFRTLSMASLILLSHQVNSFRLEEKFGKFA